MGKEDVVRWFNYCCSGASSTGELKIRFHVLFKKAYQGQRSICRKILVYVVYSST